MRSHSWPSSHASEHVPTSASPGHDPDGYPIFALRGLGRIRVLRMIALSPEAVRGAMSMPVAPDSSFHVPKRVDTVLEVAHVISYEGAMASPYDNVEREPVVSVRPVTDTITVSWARFTDSWRRCGDAWTQPPRSEAIRLIGPRFASDSIAPALYRRVTPNATVARASELADSIARAGSAMDLGALAGAPRR